MISKVTVTRVHIAEADKTGKRYGFSKGGKFVPSKRIAIKIEGDENWYSDFMQAGDSRETWQAGVEASVVLFEKNGFKNFKMPRQIDFLEERVARLEKLQGINEAPEPDVLDDPDNLPF